MLLSIIIPVYQVERYLEQCLDSVLRCDLRDCEVLLSLGNSTDRSSEIGWQYEERYPFIRTLLQKGDGLSDARNSAMEAARGEYLLFLDSDDYILPENLDFVLSRLRDGSFPGDVIVTDFFRRSRSSGRMEEIFQIGAGTPVRYGLEHLPRMLRKRQCFWNVWRYLYRREFLEEHGIRFWDGMLSEDVDFTTSVFLAEPEIIFCHSPYYVYCVEREDSLMGNPTLKRLSDTVAVLERSIRRMRESAFPYAPDLIARFQFEYILNMAITVELPPEDRPAARQLYQSWQDVLAGSSDRWVRIAGTGIGLLGLSMSALVLHRLKMFRRWRRRHLSRRKAEE